MFTHSIPQGTLPAGAVLSVGFYYPAEFTLSIILFCMPTVGLSIPSAGITERKMKLLTQNFDLAHCEGSSFTEAHNTSIEFDMEHAKEFAKKYCKPLT